MSGWNMWFKRKFSGIENQAVDVCRQANAAYAAHDYETAIALYEESLKQYRQIERWDMVLLLRLQLGDVARVSGQFAAARTHLEQAVSLARNQKNVESLATALVLLATVAARQGEIALAERLCKECLQMERVPEKALDYAAIQSLLGSISKTNADAIAHFECALEIYREKDAQAGIVSCLCSLGHCTAPGEDYTLPRGWLQECLELCETTQYEKARSYALNNLGNIERYEGNSDTAMDRYRESLSVKQSLGDEWRSPILSMAVQRSQPHKTRARKRLDSWESPPRSGSDWGHLWRFANSRNTTPSSRRSENN